MVQSLPQSDSFRILFNSPELSEVQRSGFHLFLKNGIAEELSQISCIQLKDVRFLIEIVIDPSHFRLIAPENSYRDCILKMKSYTCKLYVESRILFKDKVSGELLYQTQPEWVLLADLPIMTKRGHFVVNGSPRVIVHQVGRAPGIYFKKVLKAKKDVNNKARFYGDIVPRKGVWVRLQMNKNGEVDLKLKKSKKVRGETVQRCLELLEKEESFLDFEKKPSIRMLDQAENKPFTSNQGGTTIPATYFNPQTSFFAGIGLDDCFYSQTWQSRAFVIGFAFHKPENAMYSVSSNGAPWLAEMSRLQKQSVNKTKTEENDKILQSKGVGYRTPQRMSARVTTTFGFNDIASTRSRFRQSTPFLLSKTVESKAKAGLHSIATGIKTVEMPNINGVVTKPFTEKTSVQPTFLKPRLHLGYKRYAGKRLAFTKAEKEAFANLYNSFYKNDTKDIEERVSMSNVTSKNVTKTNASKAVREVGMQRRSYEWKNAESFATHTSPHTLSSAELVPSSKTKLSKKKVSKKQIAKKETVLSNLEKVREYLYQLFKRPDLYDLGAVGREKINTKFGISVTKTQLTALDIKETINWLSKLRSGKEEVDDIDHSQNRRVRTSSELIQSQFEIGVTRLKNRVTKKVRNGKASQIKALVPPVLQERSSVNVVSGVDRPKRWSHMPVLPFQRGVWLSNTNLHREHDTPICFDISHFRGCGGRFIKRNPTIHNGKRGITKKTFTSINPYRVTHQTKLKYYPTRHVDRSERVFEDSSLKAYEMAKTKRLRANTFNFVCKEMPISSSRFVYVKKHTYPWVSRCHGVLFADRSFFVNTKPSSNFRNSTLFSGSYSEFWNVLGDRPSILGVKTQVGMGSASVLRSTQDDLSLSSHPFPNFSVSELFSTKPINGALREFFSSSPLSQYMDQTNPLAEITHKRRISSLGVGGVSRESAGMAIRGIHPTHYGRICPIETPEGKNAGLVNSLAFYAKINDHGFIETPYYQVIKGQVQHELGFSFYSAGEESQNGLYIAPNDIKQSKRKVLGTNISTVERIPVRVADNLLDLFKKTSSYNVDCIGISPVQILSVATSLIPFLEHNDANRALMGSNMQRQAVSLMISERPLVGTGLEARVLAESGHPVQSKVSGFVSDISAHKVVVEHLSHNHTSSTSMVGGDVTCVPPTVIDKNKKGLHLCRDRKMGDTKALQNTFSAEKRFIRGRFVPQGGESDDSYRFVYPNNIFVKKTNVNKTMIDTSSFFRSQKRVASFYQNQAFLDRPFYSPNVSLVKNTFLPMRTIQKERPGLESLLPVLIGRGKSISSQISSSFISEKCKVWSVKKPIPTKNQAFIDPLEFVNSAILQYNGEFVPFATNSFAQRHVTVKTCHLYEQKPKPFLVSQLGYFGITPFQKQKRVLLPVTHSISTFSRSNQETCLIQKPLVEEGEWVQKGDMVSDCSAGDKGELSVGKNMLIAYIPWQGYNFEDAIVISDRLVREQLYTSLHIERYTVIVNDFKDKVVDTNEWFTGNLPGVDIKKRCHLHPSGLPIIGTILREGDILVGKIKYSKKKPVLPHEKLVCDILGEHNFSVQNSSLYVPKGVHEARVLTYKIKKRFEKGLQNNLRPAGAPQVVYIFLGEKRNIQVGDKISGRHGNKGIVSTILPKQDMPYLADGSPIDILLNPLGVPSRMNVGQVFECLLGLASTYLHQNFKITAWDELYGVEASQSLVFLKLYQARLQSGQNWLFQVDFPGKTRLTDGRSGECLDQWVTVGRAYMLKLIHMVNEKIHARAIGPYALVTQQPLKGRAHKGGQRLGEMEVWAVEGFGAAYILQELLTKKSDDSIGRKEVLKAMLPQSASFLHFLDPFGDSIDHPFGLENTSSNSKKENELHSENQAAKRLRNTVLGQPDTFKILICELQALCLDVGVYSMKTESFQRTFLGVLVSDTHV